MSGVPPALTAALAAQAASQAAPASTPSLPAQVVAVPPALLALERIIFLPGRVQAAPPPTGPGQPTQLLVQTAHGTVALALTPPPGTLLPQPGAPVQLTLAAGAPPTQAVLTPQAPAQAVAPAGLLARATTAAPTVAAPPIDPVDLAHTALRPGTPVRLVPLPPDMPVTLSAPAVRGAPPMSPAGQPDLQEVGGSFVARPLPPGGTPGAGGRVAAVIGVTGGAGGALALPVVEAGRARFILAGAPPLAAGTVLALEPPLRDPAPRAGPWRPLAEALTALTTTDPAAGRALAQALPQPGADLGAQLLFALRGIGGRTSPAEAWPGPRVMEALGRAGPEGLAERLGDMLRDAAQLRDMTVRDAARDDWLPVALPFLEEGELVPMQLFLRHFQPPPEDRPSGGEGAGHPAGPGGTRFLIEVAPERLGRLQLDGLVRPGRFDLLLRAEEGLSPGVAADLERLFDRLMAAQGLSGRFQVHNGRGGWVAPRLTESVGVTA